MTTRYCYWTVVDGDYTEMAKATVASARRVGVWKDFHVWSDGSVPGAICHDIGNCDNKWGCLFKLTYLRDAVQHLNYDYFVWFDTDSYFVRNPGPLLHLLQGAPMHITLECDVLSLANKRLDWWDCPNQRFAELMREMGVKNREIYNVNGGLVIVHRDAVETVCRMAWDFYTYCEKKGFRFVDEPLFAYAMQMLCGDPRRHRVQETAEFWASDWTGVYKDRLPDGSEWMFTDYFTWEQFPVNPAIVHAMRSKQALLEEGMSIKGED